VSIVILRKTLYLLSDFVRASSARGRFVIFMNISPILAGRGHGTNEMRSSAELPSFVIRVKRGDSTALCLETERACVIIKFSIV